MRLLLSIFSPGSPLPRLKNSKITGIKTAIITTTITIGMIGIPPPLTMGVSVGVAVSMGVSVSVGVGVSVTIGVSVGVPVSVGSGVEVSAGVGVDALPTTENVAG